jgi:hypothetical protein
MARCEAVSALATSNEIAKEGIMLLFDNERMRVLFSVVGVIYNN